MNKTAAIVVTYNRKQLLTECLEALIRVSEKHNLDIYVIDNASTDGTKEAIEPLISLKEQVYYYNTGKNLGGAGGFNYGIRVATEKALYDYVWIMDDDTIVHNDSLENLLDAVKILGGNFGFLASTVLWTDDSYCKMNHLLLMENSEWQDAYQLIQQGIIAIDRATFVSLLIPTVVVREVGLPIKEFFIWGDDQEYTDRIRKQYPCYFVSKSVVTHKMKINNGSNLATDNIERIDRYVYAFRNDWYTARRNGRTDKIRYAMYFLSNMKDILKHSPDNKWKRLRTLWKGFFQGTKFHPDIEYVKAENN